MGPAFHLSQFDEPESAMTIAPHVGQALHDAQDLRGSRVPRDACALCFTLLMCITRHQTAAKLPFDKQHIRRFIEEFKATTIPRR